MTYVIAEIGSNHQKDIGIAKTLIDISKLAGCDAVKFQIFTHDTLYSKYTPDFDKYHNICELIKRLEMPLNFYSDLKAYCDKIQIDFLATPFYDFAVDFLIDLGVKIIKIASFEFDDIRFVKYICSKNIPIIA